MNPYVKHFPDKPSFEQDGFHGYNSKLDCPNISMTFEDVYKGHEKYVKNTKCYYIYYVVEGNGVFRIGDYLYSVCQGDIVEIPPNVEFVFKGKMKLLLVMNPPMDLDCDIVGRENDLY